MGDEEYITIPQAAALAGYGSVSTLNAAARSGRLRTVRVSDRVQFTTRAWLDEYMGSVHPRMSHRGARDKHQE